MCVYVCVERERERAHASERSKEACVCVCVYIERKRLYKAERLTTLRDDRIYTYADT